MLECEGYKMFHGTVLVQCIDKAKPSIQIKETGTWLYNPNTKCWYCNSNSYPDEICLIVEDNTLNMESDFK